VKKALTWAALILAVLWITRDPATAAADVKNFLSALTTFASHI
jgi:hypothetical protein